MKIMPLPEKGKTCVICGSDLPPGRRRFCWDCRPRSSRGGFHCRPSLGPVTPVTDERYTTADIVALARSYGLSYGKYVSILHDPKAMLPPQIYPVVWPIGSAHRSK